MFVEGDEDTLAASGMASIYPGPYLCYYSIPTEANIQDVLDLVDDVVERQGPFDAIMGFSQVRLICQHTTATTTSTDTKPSTDCQ